jgi:hypothetical protein
VSQRDIWNGQPERLPGGFTVTKPEGVHAQVAICEVWTNPDGWELRLIMDGRGLPITTVVGTLAEMVALVETWRVVLMQTGWI